MNKQTVENSESRIFRNAEFDKTLKMPQSKSYCVTSKVDLPPQPHLEYKTTNASDDGTSCKGWFLFSLLGLSAITFILCLNMLGGGSLFMVGVNPLEGMVPIVQQGELQVYPKLEGINNGIFSQYAAFLSSTNISFVTESLTTLFERYPKEHGTVYSNCWLENPSPNRPCFFDSSWVTDLCTSDSSFGYEEQLEHYTPCFVLTFNDTESWMPAIPRDIQGHHDYGFVPVHCSIQNPKNKDVKIEMYPSKGFSRLFFPASKFNTTTYLPPLVGVKLDGMLKGDTVTVECSVITPNAFILRNNGKIAVTFISE